MKYHNFNTNRQKGAKGPVNINININKNVSDSKKI